jgi:SAM-dependent methyltransferase
MLELEWDGERVVPGKTPEAVFRQTEMRYVFAGRFAKGCVVLDVASGSGIGTHHLLRAGAKCCIGLDLSPESTQYASSNYPGCNFAVCNAADLCLADRSVDLIVSFETIEHLPDPTAFLLQCKRVLRPNGLLLCSTPNWSTYLRDGHARILAHDAGSLCWLPALRAVLCRVSFVCCQKNDGETTPEPKTAGFCEGIRARAARRRVYPGRVLPRGPLPLGGGSPLHSQVAQAAAICYRGRPQCLLR